MDDSVLEEPTLAAAGLIDQMDDLFGEAADSLGVPLPAIPLPPAVVLRIMDMQRTGCCTELAWSNTGTLAQISKNGATVSFRAMLRNQTAGTWSLSEESRSRVEAPDGRHFVHLQFSGIGIEMAVADNLGGIHLYTITGVLSKMQPSPGDFAGTDERKSDLDAVVGMHWLPLYPNEFRSPYITAATRDDGRWTTQVRARGNHALTVHHAAENRNALLYVTRSGILCLLYQNETGAWHSVSTDLDFFQSTEELLSHAAMGEDGDYLLLATYDQARRLRLSKILIDWNAASQTRGNVNYVTVAPTLTVAHLTVLEKVAAQLSDTAALTSLRVLPALAEATNPPTRTLTTIVGVFTYAASPVDSLQPAQDSFSVITRWHVESRVPALHESFTKLRSNGPTPVGTPFSVLKRQPDIITSKALVAIDSQYWHTILALGASDGTVDFRDRVTFNSIESEAYAVPSPQVSSLAQSGLEHIAGDHHPQVALSTDGSTLAFARADGTVGSKVMTLRPYGWQPLDDGITDTKTLVETAVVCLARQYSILCYSNTANDDTLALLPSDLSPGLRALFIKQVIQMTNGKPDVSMMDANRQQVTVLRDPFVPRALSAQLALCTTPGNTERNFAGQLAYVILNLRLVGTALAQTVAAKNPDVNRSDLPPSLIGLMRWSTDLIIYLVDSIMSLKRSLTQNVSTQQAVDSWVAKHRSPAIHVLLCSVSRTLLRIHSLYVQNYIKLVQASIPRSQSISERQQLVDFMETVKSMPFTFKAFHEMIANLDTSVRNSYTKADTSVERRLEIELAMLTEAHVPDELASPVQSLLDTLLPSLGDTGGSKIYFWDTAWLGIANSVPGRGETRYDAIRKVPLTKGMKLRDCRRCGAQMQHSEQEQARQMPAWLGHSQRHCFCLSYWWLA